MVAEVQSSGQFGAPPLNKFSDSLANFSGSSGSRNNAWVNNNNWIYTITGWDAVFNNPVSCHNYAFGSVLSAGGGNGLLISQFQTAVNPNYRISSGIIPWKILGTLYTAPQKFVQVTFNAETAGVSGGVAFLSFEDTSGTGIGGNGNIVHDCYNAAFISTLTNITRWNSGVGAVALGANQAAAVQGDVWRLSMDTTVGGQTTVIQSRNGVVLQTVVDNNANRLTNGVPCIVMSTMGTGGTMELKNFSCGVGL